MEKVFDRVNLFALGCKLDINITDFEDGSKKVYCNDIVSACDKLASRFTILAYPRSMDDVMVVAQLVDIIKRNSRGVKPYIILEIGTPMYARYDRVMHKNRSDGFGLDLYIKFLALAGLDEIVTHDAHSKAFGELVSANGMIYSDESVTDMAMETLADNEDGIRTFGSIKNEYIIVAPDKGLKSKLGSDVDITCDKVRDAETGKIKGVAVSDWGKYFSSDFTNSTGKGLLIIDDICERGGTFFGVAKALRDAGVTAPISLCVTHGIMPEGTDFAKMAETFDNVFVNTMHVSRVYEAEQQIKGTGGSFFCKNIFK